MNWTGSLGPLVHTGVLHTESMLSPKPPIARPGPITITWPVRPQRPGAKPTGGRLLRKARLRKKHYKAYVSVEFYGYISTCDMVDALPGSLRFTFEVNK